MVCNVLWLTATLFALGDANVLIQVNLGAQRYVVTDGEIEHVEDNSAQVTCFPPELCQTEVDENRFILRTDPEAMRDLVKISSDCDTSAQRLEDTTTESFKEHKRKLRNKNKSKKKKNRKSKPTTPPTTTTEDYWSVNINTEDYDETTPGYTNYDSGENSLNSDFPNVETTARNFDTDHDRFNGGNGQSWNEDDTYNNDNGENDNASDKDVDGEENNEVDTGTDYNNRDGNRGDNMEDIYDTYGRDNQAYDTDNNEPETTERDVDTDDETFNRGNGQSWKEDDTYNNDNGENDNTLDGTYTEEENNNELDTETDYNNRDGNGGDTIEDYTTIKPPSEEAEATTKSGRWWG